MNQLLRPLAALAMVALIAGCSDTPAETGSSTGTGTGTSASGRGKKDATDREKGIEFAECMRDNGVREFPDPAASGRLTIDAIANGSSLDTSTPAWETAIAACKDLQPPGFTGNGGRSAEQQKAALEFAQCIRDNGVKDFPDPVPDGPLVDTTRIESAAGKGGRSIPGLTAAMQTCRDLVRDQLGRP